MHPSEDQALELMFYAADTLGYLRPDRLPDIIIDPDMEALGQFTPRFVSEIRLKFWREGNRFDQGVLVHELAHAIQQFNSVPFSEEQAERARLAWIEIKDQNCTARGDEAKHDKQAPFYDLPHSSS